MDPQTWNCDNDICCDASECCINDPAIPVCCPLDGGPCYVPEGLDTTPAPDPVPDFTPYDEVGLC